MWSGCLLDSVYSDGFLLDNVCGACFLLDNEYSSGSLLCNVCDDDFYKT